MPQKDRSNDRSRERRAFLRQLITIAEAAEYWSVDHKTIRRMIDRGDLPAYRIAAGRHIRIDRDDLERLTRRIPTAGDAA